MEINPSTACQVLAGRRAEMGRVGRHFTEETMSV